MQYKNGQGKRMSKYNFLKFLAKNKWIFMNSKYFEILPFIQIGFALFGMFFGAYFLNIQWVFINCVYIFIFSMLVVPIFLAVLWNIYYKKKKLICRFCGASNVGNEYFCIKCYRLIDEDYNNCLENVIKCPACNEISEVNLDRCVLCKTKLRR